MMVVLENGGLGTGGLNFDAKIRRESTDLEDMFIAHIGGIDSFARGLLIAEKVLADPRETGARGKPDQRSYRGSVLNIRLQTNGTGEALSGVWTRKVFLTLSGVHVRCVSMISRYNLAPTLIRSSG